MIPRFVIFVVLRDGSSIEAFRWTRDEQSGIATALHEARSTGWDAVDAYAEPI